MHFSVFLSNVAVCHEFQTDTQMFPQIFPSDSLLCVLYTPTHSDCADILKLLPESTLRRHECTCRNTLKCVLMCTYAQGNTLPHTHTHTHTEAHKD